MWGSIRMQIVNLYENKRKEKKNNERSFHKLKQQKWPIWYLI